MTMVGCSRCTYPSIYLFASRSWSVVRGAHIQAFTFLFDCAGALKITVGCLTSTYPSIHFFHVGKHSEDHGRLPDEDMSKHSHEKRALTLSRARPVARAGAHIQAFTEKLALSLGSTVGCPTCTYPSIRLSHGEDTLREHGRLPDVHKYRHSLQNPR